MTINVCEVSVPGQRHDAGQVFPLALGCQAGESNAGPGIEDTCQWVAINRADLIARVEQYGAILFRGFPLTSDRDFDRFIGAFDLPNFPYQESLSNAVRVVKTDRVFTANEAPPNVRIFLHHEMAQTPVFPGKLFFFCEKPADEGGATPLCRSDLLFERIAEELPEFASDCAQKGLKYTHVMPPVSDAASGMGRSWQSTLSSDSREQAEARLLKLKYTWSWMDDGCLRVTTPVLPAVKILSNGRTAFFNQLIAAFHGWKDARNDPARSITFGDGTLLNHGTMQRVIEMAEELTFDTPWQAGDVAFVDNLSVMHGRRTFTGTRRVLASLIAHESIQVAGVT